MSVAGWACVAMTEDDLDPVLAIEREAFPTPWSRENFRFELESNPFAQNLVLKEEGQVVGYACLWIVGPELKINNIAVRADRRGTGLGRALLRSILRLARDEGCTDAELEVRPSNVPARRLYESHGFREIRRRKEYYQDTHEDAIVMAAKLSASDGSG